LPSCLKFLRIDDALAAADAPCDDGFRSVPITRIPKPLSSVVLARVRLPVSDLFLAFIHFDCHVLSHQYALFECIRI